MKELWLFLREEICQGSILKKKMSLLCKLEQDLFLFFILSSWNTALVSSRFVSLDLHRNLRADRDKTTYLKKVKSHYNYRLIAPEKNLVTKQDCQEVNGFDQYLETYEDKALGCTIADAKRGGLY